MAKITPTNMKRGGHNHVPHPKPTHAPSGHYRCPECNRIVKADVTCPCKSKVMRDSHLITRRDDSIKAAYEAAKRERAEEAATSAYTYQPTTNRKGRIETFICVDCGKQFQNSAMGRPPKRCHLCRKERQREQWRKHNAARGN